MKKKTIIILSIVFVLILLIISFIIIKNNSQESEKDYVSEFTKIGEEAYSKYYYQVLLKDKKSEEEVKAFVKKYEKIGLSFNLSTLKGFAVNMDKEEYLNLINEFLDKNRSCNEEKTMVVIYPKDPYLNTDFTSEIKLNCEIK